MYEQFAPGSANNLFDSIYGSFCSAYGAFNSTEYPKEARARVKFMFDNNINFYRGRFWVLASDAL